MLIVDAGPLINLGKIDGLGVLLALETDLVVPTSVWHEVRVAGAGMPGSAAVEAIASDLSIVPRAGSLPPEVSSLDVGEADVLALALTRGASAVGVDDLRARKIARQPGLAPIGTLGLLAAAKRQGHIETVRPFIVRLRDVNHWFGDRLLNSVLASCDEPSL